MEGAATTVIGLHHRDAALIRLFVAACRHRWDAVPGEAETTVLEAMKDAFCNCCKFTVKCTSNACPPQRRTG